MFIRFLLIFSIVLGPLFASNKARTLYNSLDQHSVAQHLALYELYPNTPEGRKALQHAWHLMAGQGAATNIPLKPSAVNAIVSLINKQPNQKTSELSDSELETIKRLANHLPNRKLKGYLVSNEEELLTLPPEEIDLTRGLLLSEPENHEHEAQLDLMALQLLAKMSIDSPPETKIRVMNQFIFEELGFRFPPHSLYAKDIDIYTFLPSVLDSRKGVCLGVSILYICLAQRLNLPLEMITPPGHIYVRYRNGDNIINIETTARGIHVDNEDYLGIDTRSLQQRNIKEVIGLAHFNQAAAYWQNEQHEKALESYKKAEKYLPDDMLLKELMGYTYLALDKEKEGTLLMKEVVDYIPDHGISKNTMPEDYLKGAINAEDIKAVFKNIDETRESIIEKRIALEKVLEQHPNFRAGWFSIATAWLQLHRHGEALKALEQYHSLDPNDPTAEYYIAIINAERLNYNNAWKHLRQAESIVHAKEHHPKALKHLRKQLAILSPE